MLSTVIERLRRSALADGFGLALVLACGLFLAAGGFTLLRGRSAPLRSHAAALALDHPAAAVGPAVACCLLPRR
jgi:hypothetical protein